VSSLTLCFVKKLHTSPRVHHRGLLHNETIAVQLCDIASGVGQGNFIDFIGVQPDLTLSAFKDGSSEALLKFQRDCNGSRRMHGLGSAASLIRIRCIQRNRKWEMMV